jgi:hypothetical protein
VQLIKHHQVRIITKFVEGQLFPSQFFLFWVQLLLAKIIQLSAAPPSHSIIVARRLTDCEYERDANIR